MKQCTKSILGEAIKQLLTLGIPAIVKAVRRRRKERREKRGR